MEEGSVRVEGSGKVCNGIRKGEYVKGACCYAYLITLMISARLIVHRHMGDTATQVKCP